MSEHNETMLDPSGERVFAELVALNRRIVANRNAALVAQYRRAVADYLRNWRENPASRSWLPWPEVPLEWAVDVAWSQRVVRIYQTDRPLTEPAPHPEQYRIDAPDPTLFGPPVDGSPWGEAYWTGPGAVDLQPGATAEREGKTYVLTQVGSGIVRRRFWLLKEA